MRKLMIAFTISLVAVNTSLAQDSNITYPLEVGLQSPGHAWINLEDCDENDETFLRIGWTLLGSVDYPWDETQHADVFFSTSEKCDSVSKEIGETSGNDGDIDISVNETTGHFPRLGDELTLADLISDNQINCSSGEEQDYYFCIKWEYDITYLTITYHITCAGGTKLRLDFKAPGPPTLLSVRSGENNLKVAWENPDDDDLGGVEIFYRLEGSTDTPKSKRVTDKTKEDSIITGLENYQTYEVWVTAVDKSENVSIESNILTGMPEPVEDFFERYKNSGGVEEGGYCFVATAAYGSYQDSMVRPLREFRDSVLAKSDTGRSWISDYYRYGPFWARALEHSETTRGFARIWLLPAVGFASLSQVTGPVAACLLMLLAPILIAMLLIKLYKFRLPVRRGAGLMILAFCLLGYLPQAQAAEESNYQMQMRFGFYYPEVDNESFPNLDQGEEKPFGEIFGSDSKFLFELGVDYQIWKGFGTLTAGGTFGFVQYIGKALTLEGDVSSDTTVFNIIPLRLSAAYHLNFLEQRMGIPLVPYVGGGISYYLWWVLDGVGNIAKWVDGQNNSQDAAGGIFGCHFMVGLKFLLDVLEPDAAANLAADVGIYNTYFFGEYMFSIVDGFGSGNHMNLGDESFMFGLMMEF